jgi:hypothetical protein
MQHPIRHAVAPVTLGLALIFGATACASTATSGGSATTGTSTTSPSTKVGKGIGARDASADVKAGKWHSNNDPYLPLVSVPVTVTNHSHERSDYIIELSLESATGKTQYDSTTVLVNALEAGQSTVQKAEFFEAPKHVPATAKVSVKTVSRISAAS